MPSTGRDPVGGGRGDGRETRVRRRHDAVPASIPVVFLRGVKAAVSVHKCVPLFFLSRQACVRTGQCFVLNGVLFLGSVLLANAVVLPLIHWYRDFLGVDPVAHAQLVHVVDSLASGMFKVFWFAPMYLISFVLSTVWYNDIAREAFKHSYDPTLPPPPGVEPPAPPPRGKRKSREPSTDIYFSELIQPKKAPAKDVVTLIMEELYRLLLMVVLLVQVTLLMFIPYVGSTLSFLLCCFVYSFYSFEYKWALEGVRLTSRMDMLEKQWVFLLGFGAPFTLATYSFSFFVSGGMYALLFPVNILLATLTRPMPHSGFPQSFPVFRIPKRIALMVIQFAGPLLGQGAKRRRGSVSGPAAAQSVPQAPPSTAPPSSGRGGSRGGLAGARQRVRFE